MSVPIHLRKLRMPKAVRRLATITCLTLFAVPAAASAACPDQTLGTPFSQWGDTNSYFLTPGGSFEGSADDVGWTLSGASLTQGNEPFYANDGADSQSVTIDGGGSAVSPYFCVDSSMSSLRFFAQQVAAGSDLQVDALVQTSHGVKTVSVGDLADGSSSAWAPTDPITKNTTSLRDGTIMVALSFSVPASDGSWQIDDVYVDPYRSG
jgi:hypothetical protein